MELGNTMYHIGLLPGQGAGYAILPGDPGRVEKIAAFLDHPQFVSQNREFTTWCGTLCGERVLVTSTGIGGPSASIALEELCQCGVHTVLRVGTCGGMQQNILPGDLVVATGAFRMEGTSKEYLPPEYPAVPAFEAVQALTKAARKHNFNCHTGVVQSKDSFYGQHSPQKMPVAEELEGKWRAWIRGGCLASEMECAALFSVAAVRRIRSGAILLCIWNQERAAAGIQEPERHDTSPAIQTAVDALKLLIEQDHNAILSHESKFTQYP